MSSERTSNVWSAPTGTPAATDPGAPNRFGVHTEHEDGGWRVIIVDPAGVDVSTRACRDEVEARTFASTVRQHIEWLSEPAFRAYYALGSEG
jgi:hypothetical protein